MSSVLPGAFSTTCEMYLPSPSCVMPRETLIPVSGTSANLIVSFGCALPLVEAIHSSRCEKLSADVQDSLQDGHPGGRREQVDRPRQDSPRRQDESGGDDDDALRTRADADVAAEAERLCAGPRVADEEGAADGRHRERERDLVAMPREHEPDRAEHHAFADAVEGRVDECAERRRLPAGARK